MKWPEEVDFKAASLSCRQALARSTKSAVVQVGSLQSSVGLYEHIGALLGRSKRELYEQDPKPNHLKMAAALIEGVKPVVWMLTLSKERVGGNDAQKRFYGVLECNEPIERVMGRAPSSEIRIAVMCLEEPSLRRYIRMRYAENHGARDAENARQNEQYICKQLDAVVSKNDPSIIAMFAFYKHTQPPFQFGGSMHMMERCDVQAEAAFGNLLHLCLDQAYPEALHDAQAAQLTVKMGEGTVDHLSFFHVHEKEALSVQPQRCTQEMGPLLQTITQEQGLLKSLGQKIEQFYACDERGDNVAMLALQMEVQQYAAILRARDPANYLAGRLYYRMAKCHERLARMETAMQLYADSKRMAEETSDKEGVGMCLIGLGTLYEANGRHDKAIEIFEEKMSLATRDGEVVAALSQMGDCYFSLGEYAKSLELQEKCREVAMRCEEAGEEVDGGAKFFIARSGSCRAKCLQATGELTQSIEIAEEARELAAALGDDQLMGEISSQIGSCLTILGRHEEAMVYHLRYWTVSRNCVSLPPGEKIDMRARAALRVGTGLVHWIRAGRKDYDEHLTTDLIDFWSSIQVMSNPNLSTLSPSPISRFLLIYDAQGAGRVTARSI